MRVAAKLASPPHGAALNPEERSVMDTALMAEGLLLLGLQHPSIIKLVAIVTDSTPTLVCTELMLNGDLKTFLRSRRHPAAGPSGATSPSPPASTATTGAAIVTPLAMHQMAARLASAMAFLERRGVIHRDIAARNVLVGEAAIDVKLADLGAARDVLRAEGGQYIATTEHTPARWMPLEALREARFSHKSDVWAFGVLLWEIGTFAKTPWGVFGVGEMAAAIERGERLEHEDRVPRFLYAIMLRCWHEVSTKRPPFEQLNDELQVRATVLAAEAKKADSGHAGDPVAACQRVAGIPHCISSR